MTQLQLDAEMKSEMGCLKKFTRENSARLRICLGLDDQGIAVISNIEKKSKYRF